LNSPPSIQYIGDIEEAHVRRRIDLVDQFTDLVVSPGEPRQLAERTLDIVMTLCNGRSGAVFSVAKDGQLSLFASRGIDQGVLDAVRLVWTRNQESLGRGETFYVPERRVDGPMGEMDRTAVASLVVVPVLAGDGLVALLYIDSLDPHFCDAYDLDRFSKFSRIVAKAVSDTGAPEPAGQMADSSWETYLERTPVEDMEREKLLLLLNRNEWNIARVARLMGVTRRTIYLRLERYKIPRERVPKTRPQRHATA
jgi:transcriptional regulator with GAF, ATPase, and Fis domain